MYLSSTGVAAATAQGSSGQFLISGGAGAPTWTSSASSQWTTSGTNIYYNSGNVGIGTASPSDALTLGSGSIIITNSAATGNAVYFNQNSVYGGFDIEGVSQTGAQTLNFGVNTNRGKPWNSTYDGLWMRIDTRPAYTGFHFFKKAATTTTETELMTILSNGNVGIGTTSPQTPLHVISAEGGPGSGNAAYGLLVTAGPGNRAVNIGTNGTAGWIQSAYTNNIGIGNYLALNPNGGNVGIGTTSPAYALDVSSFGVDGGTIRIASSSSCQFRMMEVNDTYGFSFTNVAASRMAIKRHSASSAGSEIISIMRDNPYVGIGVSNPDCPLDLGATVQNKIIGLWNPNKNGVNATDFYGFGINSGTLRYQVFATNDTHKFYGSTTLFAKIGTQVEVPGKYYAAGYLNGATTSGNFINLTTLQTQGGMAVTTSNKLVAPIAGLYQFGFQTIMQTTTGRNDVYIYLNGSPVIYTLSEDNGTGYHYRSASLCYYLSANDFVQFFCSSGTIYGEFASADNIWRKWYFYHVG